MPTSQTSLLRIATRSIRHCGKRTPRRIAAIRDRREKADQVACGGRFGREERQGCKAVPTHATVAAAGGPALLGQTSNRPWEGLPVLQVRQRLRRATARRQGAGHCHLMQHNPLALSTHQPSDERLDKSICPFHRDLEGCISSKMAALHSTMFTL
jgi:hypothetical protein